MENTKILVLGGGVYHISLVKAIREMKLNCIAVSYFAHDPALQYANASFNISSTDIGALSELINTQKVTHIITTASDINTFTQAELNQNFGFNGVFTSMVKAVSHKPELVSLLHSLKLPTPKTDIIDLFDISCVDDKQALCIWMLNEFKITADDLRNNKK